MKAGARFLFLLCMLVLMPMAARAAITCSSVSSTGFTWYYVNGTTAAVQLSFTVTCNRGATTDPTTFSYANTVNDGLHHSGANNNAQLTAGAQIGYDLFLGSCSGTQWRNKSANDIAGTVTWGASQTGTSTDTEYYWACINTAQTLSNSGWYTDTVTMTVKNLPGNPGVTITGTIPINIFAPSSCVLTTGPGTINMSYTAFSPSAVTASTTFQATCSNGMSYTMGVSPTSGTLAGVSYTITPDTTASTGTGIAQSFGITATAAAAQSGACTVASCTASQVHTLTISY